MAINIGATGSTGRFIGGGAGVLRDDQLMLFLDPFKYGAWTGETDSSFSDLSGHGNDITAVNGARNRTDGFWSYDGTNDFSFRADDSDFDFGTTTDFTIQIWYNNQGGTSNDWYLISKGKISAAKGNPSTGYSLFYDASASELRLRIQETTGITSPTSDHNWGASGWQNLALCVDRSTNAKFYANGELVTTDGSTSNGLNASSDRQFIIGGGQNIDSITRFQRIYRTSYDLQQQTTYTRRS